MQRQPRLLGVHARRRERAAETSSVTVLSDAGPDTRAVPTRPGRHTDVQGRGRPPLPSIVVTAFDAPRGPCRNRGYKARVARRDRRASRSATAPVRTSARRPRAWERTWPCRGRRGARCARGSRDDADAAGGVGTSSRLRTTAVRPPATVSHHGGGCRDHRCPAPPPGTRLPRTRAHRAAGGRRRPAPAWRARRRRGGPASRCSTPAQARPHSVRRSRPATFLRARRVAASSSTTSDRTSRRAAIPRCACVFTAPR